MAKKRSVTFYLATLLISSIPLCCHTTFHNESTENPSEKLLVAKSQCLSSCRLHTEYDKTLSESRAPQDVRDSDCYRNCIQSTMKGQQSNKGKKRSTMDVPPKNEKYDCPLDTEIAERRLGDIQNLSVVFLQEKGKDGNVTWVANVTWDVFLNESLYFSDEWRGFLILWVNKESITTPTIQENYCRFNYKNNTNFIIKSGPTEWAYPDAIDIGVLIYPPTEDDVNGLDLVTFDPKVPKENGTNASSPFSTPTPSPTTQPLYPFLSIFFGCFLGITAVCFALYLTWKRRIKNGNGVRDQENFEYDASILYSTLDEEWVTGELIPLLETQHNFKCFIHFRDFEVGKILHENMANAVYKCRKNLAVVSKNFLNSNYCKEELSMALERVQRCGDYSLIVVNLDGVSKDQLPRALLTRTFVNLTNSQEQNTWKNRLVRQISVEEESASQAQTPQRSIVRLESNMTTSVVQEGDTRRNESVI
ncbi:uncharacterized protein LOC116307320 [Actinia tenebrosa]|uniref:Uncharacterized protein LOC116307320 n=1 Tax=Actinia tenebrosa TaxID=6105 RepID=A0A6P8J650_ACTTE|nr:uncharacterized protein LOC116307320 [Actinia tenebrosa]